MKPDSQTIHSHRTLGVMGLRHLRRFELFEYEPRSISNDALEELGRVAAEAMESHLQTVIPKAPTNPK